MNLKGQEKAMINTIGPITVHTHSRSTEVWGNQGDMSCAWSISDGCNSDQSQSTAASLKSCSMQTSLVFKVFLVFQARASSAKALLPEADDCTNVSACSLEASPHQEFGLSPSPHHRP